jgi:hypothetical protein
MTELVINAAAEHSELAIERARKQPFANGGARWPMERESGNVKVIELPERL